MTARPIQLSDAAFLMLRKSIGNPDTEIALPVRADDILAAAELVDAEYATVSDADSRIELRATPAGLEYMKMIDALLKDRGAEFEARSKAARFAVANTVIEGGHVLPETEELMNEWARGEIDDDELIEQGLKRYGPGV